MIVRIFDIHGQSIIVGHGRNHFEQMERVGTHNDFFGMTHIFFEFVRVENDIDQDGVGLVKIDDFEAIVRVSDRGIGQNILDGRDHITNRLNLYRFDCENIVRFVHWIGLEWSRNI